MRAGALGTDRVDAAETALTGSGDSGIGAGAENGTNSQGGKASRKKEDLDGSSE